MIRRITNLSGSAFLFLLLCISTSVAQSRPGETNTIAGNEEIHGTVKLPSGDTSGTRATVTLRSMGSPEVKTLTNPDGEFRFTHLRPDHYTIIVDAGDAYEKTTETVSVGFSGSVPAQGNVFGYAIPAVYDVRIYLLPKGHVLEADASTHLSGSAKKLFRQALEDQKSGNHVHAIEQLKRVIVEGPTFAAAYRELGAEYLKTAQGQLAVDVLRKAVDVDPSDASLRMNYGVALLNQNQYSEAEAELQRSIKQSRTYSVVAHYYLGVALITVRKIADARMVFEGLVKNGGDNVPLVHRYLGGIYLREKRYGEAADELEKYLKLAPTVSDADKIRMLIQESRGKI